MKMDDHTWVVCAYKESKYLEECIESILNQTVKSNVIISTSTPNDYIKKLAKKYKIKLVINKGEKGIGQDWNYGVSQTETKYVTVAHQDDVYNENYLEEIKKYIDRKNGFIIAFTDYREIKNGGGTSLNYQFKNKKIDVKTC